jgi:hypothetical protein
VSSTRPPRQRPIAASPSQTITRGTVGCQGRPRERRTVGSQHWRGKECDGGTEHWPCGHQNCERIRSRDLGSHSLNVLGQPVSNAIPSAAQNVRDMLAALWKGIKDLVPINWNNYFYRHH